MTNQSSAAWKSLREAGSYPSRPSLLPPTHEEALVLAAQAGSADAFAALRDLYARRIFRTIIAITKNREDAEDALQESFLRAFVAIRTFEGRANFYSWLTRIAINSALMILRKRRNHPEAPLGYLHDLEDEPHLYESRDSAPDPEQVYDQRQRQGELLAAVRRLDPKLRAVIETQMGQSCSAKEIAEQLGLSEAAVKSRLYRARRRLAMMRPLSRMNSYSVSTRQPVNRCHVAGFSA